MKFHPLVIEKLINLYQNYGGHPEENKLRTHLNNLDFTVYERKTGHQDMILVLTEDYVKSLQPKG
jgi:hypothetical protein